MGATGWKVDRGRSSELDKTGTGTASADILDEDGTFDPTNPTGPYSGLLDPMKPAAIALFNPVTETWSTVFRGHVDSWEHELTMWDDDDDVRRGLDQVTLQLADAFDLMGALEMTPGHHGDTTALDAFGDVYFQGQPSNLPGEAEVQTHVDTRINKLLDDADFPEDLRHVFSGNVTVQGTVYKRRDQLLSALADAADAEFPGVANEFMSKEGLFVFHGRFARFFPARPGYGINTWLVGGHAQADVDADVALISGLKFRRAKSDIINACIALPQGVDDTDAPGQLVKDDTSIATYGWRSVSFENLLTYAGHNDDLTQTTALEETHKFADYYVGNYKDPKTRVSELTLRTHDVTDFSAAATWALLCGVEIGDIISLATNHPGGGGFDEDFYVEGIHYEAVPMRGDLWDVTLKLDVSPRSFFAYNPFGEIDEGES